MSSAGLSCVIINLFGFEQCSGCPIESERPWHQSGWHAEIVTKLRLRSLLCVEIVIIL